MGIVFRQSIKTTIVTFSGALLGALLLYVSSKIPQQQFGFSQLLLRQAIVGMQFVLAGIQTTLYVFVHRYNADDKRRKVLITISFLVPVVITALLSIGYAFAHQHILAYYQPQDRAYIDKFFFWVPIYVLLWAFITLLEHYLMSQMKVAVSSFIREIVLRVFNIGLVLAYYFGLISFEGFIIAGILVHFIPLASMLLLATKTKGFGLSFRLGLFSGSELKAITDFALFHLLLNVSITLLDNINTLLVSVWDTKGLVSVAIYAFASFIITIFRVPYRAMAAAATPMLNKAFENNEMAEVKNLFTRSGINILVVTTAMAVIIACNAPNVVLVLGEKYSNVDTLVWILMIGAMIDMVTGLNNELLSVSRYYRFNFYITVLLLVITVVLDYFLIPEYGVYGAAWASTIALGVYNIIKMLFLKSKLQLHPFSTKSLLVLLSGIIAGVAGYFLPFMLNPVLDTTVRTAIIIIIYSLCILLFKPSVDVNTYIDSIIKNKKLF